MRGRGLGAPVVHRCPVDGSKGSVFEVRARHESAQLSAKLFLMPEGIVAAISLSKGRMNADSPDVTCSPAEFGAYTL